MSPEMYTIISVAVGLAALILNGQLGTRRAIAELRTEIIGLRGEIAVVREQLAALAERVARLEGAILGPHDFVGDIGTGNAT